MKGKDKTRDVSQLVDYFSSMHRDLGVFLSTVENQVLVTLTCVLAFGRQSKRDKSVRPAWATCDPSVKRKENKGLKAS